MEIEADKQFMDCGEACRFVGAHTRHGECILAEPPKKKKEEEAPIMIDSSLLQSIAATLKQLDTLAYLPALQNNYFTGKLRVWENGMSPGYLTQDLTGTWVFVPSYKEEKC